MRTQALCTEQTSLGLFQVPVARSKPGEERRIFTFENTSARASNESDRCIVTERAVYKAVRRRGS